MKLASRLLVALTVCLLAIPMIGSPVMAQTFHVQEGSVDSDEGYVGDTIRIYGEWHSDHGSYIYVYFELYNEDEDDWPMEKVKYEDSYDDNGDTYYEFDMDFDVPECFSGVHEILVCDDDDPDEDVDTLEFTVYPFIEIDTDEGPAGTEVEVTGHGWDEDESEISIRFFKETGEPDEDELDDDDYYVEALEDEEIEMEEDDEEKYGMWATTITFEVPPASKGVHYLYAVGDENDDIEEYYILGAEFEVTPGISIDVTEGAVGDTVTVSGSGFDEDEKGIKILFDGKSVRSGITADEDGIWEEDFEVPSMAAGTYDVTAEGNDTDESDIDPVEFELGAGVTVIPLSGEVGTTITVSGDGFAQNSAVTVTYDGTVMVSGTTSSTGSFSGLTFEAAHTQNTHTVDHPIVVTCGASTFTKTFSMESNVPPKPVLTAPPNDSRIGHFTKVKPTFQWKAVSDPSGVTYSLQIGTGPDFAQVLIAKAGLTEAQALLVSATGPEMSYTLTDMEALPYGTYYWRVKAIDGAMNDSGWTAPYSFKAGYLPLWAFIAIVAAAAVLIGGLIFLLARRGAPYD
jgi:hypothetical protein